MSTSKDLERTGSIVRDDRLNRLVRVELDAVRAVEVLRLATHDPRIHGFGSELEVEFGGCESDGTIVDDAFFERPENENGFDERSDRTTVRLDKDRAIARDDQRLLL